MRSLRTTSSACLLGFLLVAAGPSARAGQVWTVSLDTSLLVTDFSGPFGFDIELVGTNGNTATVSDFSFGSSGAAGPGPAFLTGGASGDLATNISLNDSSSFFSDFNQQFTPGSTLSFTVDTTLVAPPPGGSPDNLSIVIFSAYDPVNGYNPLAGTGGTPIPTTDPSGNNTFLNIDFNGPGSTTATGYPGANGDIPITVTPQSVPEPTSALMLFFGLLGIAGALFWQGHRRPCPAGPCLPSTR